MISYLIKPLTTPNNTSLMPPALVMQELIDLTFSAELKLRPSSLNSCLEHYSKTERKDISGSFLFKGILTELEGLKSVSETTVLDASGAGYFFCDTLSKLIDLEEWRKIPRPVLGRSFLQWKLRCRVIISAIKLNTVGGGERESHLEKRDSRERERGPGRPRMRWADELKRNAGNTWAKIARNRDVGKIHEQVYRN
ncbi:hypothetical protein C0J52_04665 [Blattella germanica]|nr:hypothetical protein C0J52_04665 [Blattella germanica]